MIKYYLEENYQLTNQKILLSWDYFYKLNLSFEDYYNIYDNIEKSKNIEDLRNIMIYLEMKILILLKNF